jgi:hypothetical protein
MKRYLAILAVAFTLNGCAGTPAGDALRVLTTTYNNPVGEVDVYRVQNAYAAALSLVAEYRRYCWSKPYAAIVADPIMKPVCEKRRAVVRVAQMARRNARAALDAAETFIINNPTLNAATAVRGAWDAVAQFQNSIPAK